MQPGKINIWLAQKDTSQGTSMQDTSTNEPPNNSTIKRVEREDNQPSSRSFHTVLFNWETVSAWRIEPNLLSISSRLISAGCEFEGKKDS